MWFLGRFSVLFPVSYSSLFSLYFSRLSYELGILAILPVILTPWLVDHQAEIQTYKPLAGAADTDPANLGYVDTGLILNGFKWIWSEN